MFHPQYYIYLLPMLLSAIFSIKAFKKKWPQPFRAFTVLIFCTLCIELFALWWNLSLHATSFWHYQPTNMWVYNFYLLPQYLFYFYFFYKVLKSSRVKAAIVLLACIFISFALFNYWFLQGPFIANSYTIIFCYVSVVVLDIFLLNQLSKDDEVVELMKSPVLWMVAGMFIFHFCSLPCFIFLNYLNITNINLSLSFYYTIQLLNIIMYSFYLISYLCNPIFPK